MRHFSSESIFHWLLKKCILPTTIAAVIRETNFFIKIMQPISQTFPEKMESNRQRVPKKNCHKVVSCWAQDKTIAKDKDPSSRVKMHQFFFFWGGVYHHFMYTCWVDVISLTCLTFKISLIASLDILFSDSFILQIKITKGEHKNIFCGPSKIFKNISWRTDICLKFFMAPTKTLRSLLLHTECTVLKSCLYSEAATES